MKPFLAACCMLLTIPFVHAAETDVLIYGGTPAGIAAAISASGNDTNVLLVEPTGRIGGMTTNGLSHTDFRSFEGISGMYYEFTQRILQYYKDEYGEDSNQVKQCFRGTHGEPKVNLEIFYEMLGEHPTITIKHGWLIEDVETENNHKILAVSFQDKQGVLHQVKTGIFIDATYEGDLMAKAGIPYRIGREARSEYGESLAPEKADNQVQGYNFRLIMTKELDNLVLPQKPAGYDREMYTGILPLMKDGRIKGVFGYSPPVYIYKAQIPHLPNGKYDINDVSHSPVRLSMPDINNPYPNGSTSIRRQIVEEHVRWNMGLLYFLQNDEAVPEPFQAEAREWGWCKDEFVENDHIPVQLYIREARRMIGQYVFTENDTEYAPGDARTVLHKDAIAMGDYGENCHGTGREGTRFNGKHTGEFYKAVAPYQIPYGVLIPKDVRNLLVPVAASSSHVGFCALRLEPIWSLMGQAAGYAANIAVQEEMDVQNVPVKRIQSILHKHGAATIYFGDITPGHPDFEMAQWWGTAGGFHGLAPTPEKKGQRGKHILGQYFEAFPHHDANLDQPMDKELAAKWIAVANELDISDTHIPQTHTNKTRRDWLKRVWQHRPQP